MKKFLLLLVALVATSAAWAQDTYVVAGVSALCGSNWSATDANNQMTLQNDGTYVKTYANVAVGSYQFKVVKNGSEWIGDKTGQNVQFAVNTACDVNIYFNPSNNDITVAGNGVGEKTFEINKVIAVGNGSGNWLNGSSWDPAASVNEMTQVGDLVYEISYNDVPVGGDYQVKFAVNGSWDDNFGGSYAGNGVETDAVYNGGNIYVNVEKAGTVTLRLDLSNFDYASKSGAKFTITSPKSEEPFEPTYFIKHDWAGEGNWTWQEMTKVGEMTTEGVRYSVYSYEGIYGGTGCNINIAANDAGAQWFAEPELIGAPQVGDECSFRYSPELGQLAIINLNPEPVTTPSISKITIKGQEVALEAGKYNYNMTLTEDINETDVEVEVLHADENTGVEVSVRVVKPVMKSEEYRKVTVTLYQGEEFVEEYSILVTIDNTPTGINDINVNSAKVVKAIENGQVVILKGDKKFNVAGQAIK